MAGEQTFGQHEVEDALNPLQMRALAAQQQFNTLPERIDYMRKQAGSNYNYFLMEHDHIHKHPNKDMDKKETQLDKYIQDGKVYKCGDVDLPSIERNQLASLSSRCQDVYDMVPMKHKRNQKQQAVLEKRSTYSNLKKNKLMLE